MIFNKPNCSSSELALGLGPELRARGASGGFCAPTRRAGECPTEPLLATGATAAFARGGSLCSIGAGAMLGGLAESARLGAIRGGNSLRRAAAKAIATKETEATTTSANPEAGAGGRLNLLDQLLERRFATLGAAGSEAD